MISGLAPAHPAVPPNPGTIGGPEGALAYGHRLPIRRLTVIGVGLIGGSLARALRRARLVEEVVGCGRSLDNLQRAVELGVIDRYSQDPAAAVTGADLIFVAVPLGAMAATFAAIRDHLAPGAILTDGGSVKGSVVADARQVFGQVPERFVPGHPIAGTEHSGVEASFAELYRNRRVILTPLGGTDPTAITRVQAMWEACGAEVIHMDVHHHDEVLAATSHLPHLLAYALVDSLARLRENDEIFRYAAGGFRDFTRIASSHPVMWRDICLANREALGQMLDRFQGELAELAAAVGRGDGEGLLAVFERAKAARDRYVGQLG
jgi:prephenate dehydrogenase